LRSIVVPARQPFFFNRSIRFSLVGLGIVSCRVGAHGCAMFVDTTTCCVTYCNRTNVFEHLTSSYATDRHHDHDKGKLNQLPGASDLLRARGVNVNRLTHVHLPAGGTSPQSNWHQVSTVNLARCPTLVAPLLIVLFSKFFFASKRSHSPFFS
jgi:hypothetical protein